MEINNLNAINLNQNEENMISLKDDYTCKLDWKFHQIVYLSNIFQSTLAIEPFSAIDLELSLKSPEIDSLCLNLLFKLLMKKAMFKPNAKVNDLESRIKLHELLCKKLIFFYKIYARSLVSYHNQPFTQNLIDKDLLSFDENNTFKIRKAENYYGEINFEQDLKKSMIMNLFRCLKGKNPIIDYIKYQESMIQPMQLSQNKIIIPFTRDTAEIKNDDEDDLKSFKSESSLSNKQDIKNEANDSESEENENDNFNLINQNVINPELSIREQVINVNIKEDTEGLTFFSDFSLKDKVEILYFFFIYSIEFSGRSHYFKQDLLNINNQQITKIDQITGQPIVEIIPSDQFQIKYLGKDKENNKYYTIPCNRTCAIMKRNLEIETPNEISHSSYQEIERFLDNINKQIANPTEQSKRKVTQKQEVNCLIELSTNIKDNLLSFKEFEEEDKRKESTFNKKLFLNKNSALPNKEYMLMNISEHVTTRRQLNKLTESTVIQPFNSNKVKQQKELTIDDIKLIKIEQQKQERERRIQERNKLIEEGPKGRLGRKRDRKSYDEDDEDEYNSKNYDDLEEYEPRVKESNRIKILRDDYIDNDKDQELEEQDFFDDDLPDTGEIVMDCYLIYRYQLNQIELEGNWGIANNQMNEKLSYLFNKSNEKHRILLNKSEVIDLTQPTKTIQTGIENVKRNNIFYTSKDLENMISINLCAANIHEILLLNNQRIISEVLKFLSNEYSGYFVYFSKTIEDKFTLKLTLTDSLVIITGEGTNILGNFKLNGYMNLFRDKDELMRNNNLEDNFIRLGKVKLNKQYVVFNPNENYRVLKSFTHRKKVNEITGEEELDEDAYQDNYEEEQSLF